MAVTLEISWAGRSASDFARQFIVAANIKNFSAPLKKIGEEVVAPSITANFDSQGRPSWRPLAASTVERKSSAGVSDPSRILVHTGALKEAATNASNYHVSKDELVAMPFGIDYWVYHQTGGGVPQRVIMMLQSQDRTKVTRIIADFVRTFMIFDPSKAGARVFTGGLRGS